MEKIKNISFENGLINMESTEGRKYNRPLSDFPPMDTASIEELQQYEILLNGESIRWANMDMDIHISSFYERAGEVNLLAFICYHLPMINISELAKSLGINKSLMYNYLYGIKRPSPKRLKEIKDQIRSIGNFLANIE